MNDKICINCKTIIDEQKYVWKAEIKTLINHHYYYEVIIEARGSSLHLLVGTGEFFNWVAIPYLDISTTLSHFNDIFWNEEKLCTILNPVDSATIAYSIAYIEKHVLNNKKLIK